MSKFAAVPLDLVRKVLLPKIATPLTLLHILLGGLIALVFAAGADPAMAQGYIGDARRVGMGGAGDWGNTAWDLGGGGIRISLDTHSYRLVSSIERL